jgi:hypothetical protein
VKERTLEGSLTFLGFAISILAVFYFAIEYIPQVSQWSQLAALILLALAFAFLGVYLARTALGEPFFAAPRLHWLRPPTVLYLLALITGIVAEIRLLNLDDVSRPIKILVSLVLGVGLIVVASRGQRRKDAPASSEEP